MFSICNFHLVLFPIPSVFSRVHLLTYMHLTSYKHYFKAPVYVEGWRKVHPGHNYSLTGNQPNVPLG